ncbi:hypothetical protein FKP32DRAFT_1586758 [Trametes sanguinea]|nr:hypothetical protein FKP32DRAFT_1586758 [Trametes sanguinea]
MDSIAPTTKQEAISRKVMHRNGIKSIPLPTSSPAKSSPAVRRSRRRAGANPAGPSASAQQAPAVGADEQSESISSAPAPQGRPSKQRSNAEEEAITVDKILHDAEVMAITQLSAGEGAGASGSNVAKSGETGVGRENEDVRARSEVGEISMRAAEKRVADVPAMENVLPGSSQEGAIQERDRAADGPPQPARPLGLPSRVFFPPTSAQLAAMRAQPLPSLSTFKPLPFQFVPPPPRTNEQPRESASTRAPQRPSLHTPSAAHPPYGAGPSSTRSSPPPVPMLPAVSVDVYRPLLAQAREVLEALGPLADQDAAVGQQVEEMNILLDQEEKRAIRITRELRKIQSLRLAMQELFFEKLKTDPTILEGTWRPDGEPREQTAPVAGPSASREPSEQGVEQGGHQAVDETIDSEENEIREVEDMTSRELMSSDLPSTPNTISPPSSTGRGKRPAPVDEDDVTEEEGPESPCKRPRRSARA